MPLDRSRPALAARVGCVLALAGLVAWLWSERYFLRMIPVPQQALSILYHGPLTKPTPMRPSGQTVPSKANISTPEGLRAALDDLQFFSPINPIERRPELSDFQSWMNWVTTRAMQCTDGTLLMQLVAWNAGIAAREWWLLPADWEAGGGHSMVEIQDPATGHWRLVDGQHGAMIQDRTGAALDMKAVLDLWHSGRTNEMVIDYGQFRDAVLAGSRGPTVEDYLFRERLLDQPVLNLRPPTYVATALRNDPVIAWVIYGSNARHDPRIFTTKAAVLGILFFLGAALWPRKRS